MISGRTKSTGTYSSHSRTFGRESVVVSHMPEDSWSIRIAFRHNEETSSPVMKLSNAQAEALWCSLSGMAADLKWTDLEGNPLARTST